MTQARIVTVTLNPSVDRAADVEHVAPESKLRCGPARDEPGGGGLNVARAIRLLAGDAEAMWSMGGHTGARLGDLLDREGLPHRPIEIRAQVRENLAVFERSTGQQYRFVFPGPDLAPDEVERWLEAVGNLDPPPAFLVLSGSLAPGAPPGLYGQLAERAPDETRIVLDTSGDALGHSLNSGGFFLCKPNLRELGEIAGRPLESDPEIERAARDLVERNKVEVVLVSLGSGGAILVTRTGTMTLRAPTVRIRSKVGAGDSMVAGVVVALARGHDLVRAARFGVACGAAAVTTPGSELCRREDAERIYERVKRVAE